MLSGDSSRIDFTNTPFHEGYCYLTPNDGGLYADVVVNNVNTRVRISDTSGKQDTLTFDSAPASGSTNPVTSGGVYTALSAKEASSNKVTSLSAASTDTQYPSAKAVYDLFNSITDGNEVSY